MKEPSPEFSDSLDSQPKKESTSYYADIISDAFENNKTLELPELDLFAVSEIDTQAIVDFTRALVNFFEEKERGADDEQLQLLHEFAEYIHHDLFSGSPNILNHVPLPERFRLMAKATRIHIVQKTFGYSLVGATAYDISFMRGSLEQVVETSLEGIPISEQLDILNQLQTVGAQSIANGEWSRSGYKQLRQVYETLAQSEDYSIFVRLAAQSGLEVLNREYEDPQLSVIRHGGQTNDSRLYAGFDNISAKDYAKKFFSTYCVDDMFPLAMKIIPATKDAAVCINATGLAFGVMRTTEERNVLESDGLLDTNRLKMYQQNLESFQQRKTERNKRLAIQAFHYIYDQERGRLDTGSDFRDVAEKLHKSFPVLSLEEWEICVRGDVEVDKLPDKDFFIKKAEDANRAATDKFVESVYELRDHFTDQSEVYLFSALGKALEEGDVRHAFELATVIISGFDHKEEQDYYESLAVLRYEELQKVHRENFEKAEEEYGQMTEDFNTSEIGAARLKIYNDLNKNLDTLFKQIEQHIDKKLEEAKQLPVAHFVPLRELLKEIRESEDVTTEDVLLFQHVHSSDLSKKIEDEFGFRLADLTLKEQYYFLHYIQTVTTEDIDAVQKFISRYGAQGMRTFLSLEHDSDLGEKIISFGSNEIASRIFEKYSELLDVASRVHEYVCRTIDCETIDDEVFASIRTTILHKATHLLKTFVETPTQYTEAEVAEQLEAFRQEAVIFTSTLQKLHKAGLATLEDFKDVSLESVSPTELSDDDIANMKKMYGENWKATLVTSSELLAGFDVTLENPDARMYTFRHQGTVRGFFAITPIEKRDASNAHDTTVKFTAFNLDPSYKGARIGEEMMRRQLDSIAREKIIFATTNGDDFITSAYIEDGFVGVGMTETGKREDGTYEVPHVIHVYRNASLSDDVFVTKKMTKDEIRKCAAQESLAQQNDNTKFFIMDVMGEHDYGPFQEDVHDDDFVWVLTRSVYEKETGKVYLAYERVSRDVVDRLKSEMEPAADVASVGA